jgi:hypothetical protein
VVRTPCLFGPSAEGEIAKKRHTTGEVIGKLRDGDDGARRHPRLDGAGPFHFVVDQDHA